MRPICVPHPGPIVNRNPDDILDEMLILRIQAGDRRALAQLVNRWHRRLCHRAYQITGQSDLAADLAQETWLAVIRGLPRLRDPATFRSWAYRIIHNKSVDALRAQSRHRAATEILSNDSPSATHENEGTHQVEKTEESDQLRRAIRALDVDQRLLLRMFYTDGMTLREISRVTDTPVGTLKYRLFQLRQRLKQTIERQNHE